MKQEIQEGVEQDEEGQIHYDVELSVSINGEYTRKLTIGVLKDVTPGFARLLQAHEQPQPLGRFGIALLSFLVQLGCAMAIHDDRGKYWRLCAPRLDDGGWRKIDRPKSRKRKLPFHLT